MSARWGGLFLAALAACATPREAEPGVQALSEIRFEGNSDIDAKTLKSKIVSAESSPWPFGKIRPYDPDVFRTDLLRVERYYHAQGWLSARVAETRVEETEEGAAVLVVRVEQGSRTRVVALEMPGFDTVAPELKSRIQAVLPLAVGDPFTEAAYDALKSRLVAELRENGYAEATVVGKVVVDPARAEARVLLDVKPGVRFKLGRIVVSGAQTVSKKRILDVAALKEGDWYSISALNAAQQRIFDMGVFGGVRVSRGAAMRDRGVVPVLVTVRETAFQSVRVGAGLGLERGSRQEASARVEYTHRNLFGGLRRLSVQGRAGYAFLPSPFDPLEHGLVGLLALEFTQPNVALLGFDITGRVEGERSIDLSFTDNALRGRLAVPKYFGRRLVLNPSFNVEFHQIDGTVPARAGALTTDCPSPCLVTYGEVRVTMDQRNDPIDPVRGFFLDLGVQRGLGALSLGQPGYWRFLPEVRAYRRGPFDTVFAGRLKLGAILPDEGSAPVMARFFGGGASDMRGFGTRRLSPFSTVACAPGESGCVAGTFPVGGQGMMEASVEARLRLGGGLGLVLFADAGTVTPTFADLALGKLEYAAGVGLRYRLGAFPSVRADFAWRLHEKDPWKEEDRFQFHITLGEAF